MPPRVIADSDDESDAEERFSPPRPRPQPAPGVAHSTSLTRSSDQESLATVSTDPAYFQKIYNDQHEAARERSRDAQAGGPGALKDDSHYSSLATVSEVAGHGTIKGSHESSMTSTTEPNVERYGDMFPEERWGGETQATTPGEGIDHRRIESAADLWSVPSDSETPRQSSLRKSTGAGKRRLGSTQGDATAHGSVVPDTIESSGDHRDSPEYPDTKRKRLQKAKQALAVTSDGVDVGIYDPLEDNEESVGRQKDRATVFSIPVPGPPIQRDDPVHTPIQKKSVTIPDSTLEASSTSSAKRRSLLPQQKTLYSAGSSGSNTNFNSPRNFSTSVSSNNFESVETPLVKKNMVTKTREYGSINLEIRSSPDALALGSAKEPEVHADDATFPEGSPRGPQQNHEVVESESTEAVIEEPAPKRRRGRPKKKENLDEPISEREREEILLIDAEPPEGPPKKKRGRPRKQPPPRSPDRNESGTAVSSPQVGGAEVVVISDEDETAGSVLKNGNGNFYIEIEGASKIPHNRGNSISPEEEDFAHDHENEDDEDGEAGYQEGKNGQDPHASGLQPNGRQEPRKRGPTKDNTPDADTDEAARPEATRTGKESMKRASPASKTAKPKYRVGLSKRSKIAPLLKSVRK